jgi:tetratricopeptide (TPR) repeat protein
MTVFPRFALAISAVLFLGSPARAAFEEDEAKIDKLVAQRKYLSAAKAIDERADLRGQPRFVRKMSHILVNDYAITVGFSVFALRDLKESEDIEKIRGTPGQYTMIGGDLEKLLHDALAAHPNDPDLQFAVGEYLSRGKACGCASPRLFVGERADEYPYFERAYRAGIRDDWSLFRMGVHDMSGAKPDLAKAVELFGASLKEKPDQVGAHYNAAIAYFWLKDYTSAKTHSAQALGRYGKADLDADTYSVHARIETALGDTRAAEKAFRKALELRPPHEAAFTGLLDLLRSQKRFDEYKRRAASFIALDYGNTYPFGVYLGYVGEAGVIDTDKDLARELAGREYARPQEVGAVFYSLGRLAELASDRALAYKHYRKSLSALRKLGKPPQGSIEALTGLVERTRSD